METTNASEPFEETRVRQCYQCGKCTAGCPVAEHMDVAPNQLVRLAQLREYERGMACMAVWACVSCQTCTARCPQSVDCAGVMDVFRQMAAEKGTAPPDLLRVLVFQRAFLDSIRRNGRVNEIEMMVLFKTMAFMKDFNVPLLMKDSLLAPKLMQRGKFHVVGEKVKDRAVVKRIFDRCMTNEE